MRAIPNRTIFVAILSLLLTVFVGSPSESARPKKGDKCLKLGQNVGKSSGRLTCAPVTTLRWVSNPRVPEVGSIFKPAEMGKWVEVGNLEFKVLSIDFQVGSEICSNNAWNDGCRITGFRGEVDPDSSIRWVGVEFEVENGFVATVEPGSSRYTYYLVTSTNEFIENDIVAVFNRNLMDVVLPEGEKARGKIVFKVPKTVTDLNSLLLIRDQAKNSTKDYYFLLDW